MGMIIVKGYKFKFLSKVFLDLLSKTVSSSFDFDSNCEFLEYQTDEKYQFFKVGIYSVLAFGNRHNNAIVSFNLVMVMESCDISKHSAFT